MPISKCVIKTFEGRLGPSVGELLSVKCCRLHLRKRLVFHMSGPFQLDWPRTEELAATSIWYGVPKAGWGHNLSLPEPKPHGGKPSETTNAADNTGQKASRVFLDTLPEIGVKTVIH